MIPTEVAPTTPPTPPAATPVSSDVVVDVNEVVRLLCLAAGVLLVAGLVCDWALLGTDPSAASSRLVRLFRLDEERNVPTAFSTLLLTLGAMSGVVMGITERARRARRGWLAFGMVLAFLAMDEALQWHELLEDVGRAVVGTHRPKFLVFVWVVPATVLVSVLGTVAYVWWQDLDRGVRSNVAVAVATFLSGAIGLETLSGAAAASVGYRSAPYLLLSDLEEGLEMGGAILLVRAALRAWANSARSLRISGG